METLEFLVNEEYKVLPKSEFESRWHHIQALMNESGIDALFITSYTNFYYISGIEPPFCISRPVLAVMPREGEPILLGHSLASEKWRRLSYVSDENLRPHNVLGLPLDLVVSTLKQVAGEGGTIGAELGEDQLLGIPFNDMVSVQKALASQKWVDGSAVLNRVRTVKSKAEIAFFKRACEITNRVFDKVPELAHVGMEEEELAASLRLEFAKNDGFSPFTYIRAGPDPLVTLGTARFPTINRRAKLEEGYLLVDLGCCYNYYWSDFSRHFWLGEPSDKAKRLHAISERGLNAGIAAIKPGAMASDPVKAAINSFKADGLNLSLPGSRIGHGLGIDLCEFPDLALTQRRSGQDMALKPGMSFAMEPMFHSETGWWVLEHDIAIKDDGYPEVFSKSTEFVSIR